MTVERARDHESTAESLRQKQEYWKAGEYFTVAAYEQIGDRPPERFGQSVSRGLYYLLHGAVCCRLAALHEHCQIRCEQGILIAEDMKERLERRPIPSNAYDRARIGVWDEFTGDFHVVAGTPDEATGAYDSAKSMYTDTVAEEFELSFAEREHRDSIRFYEDIARAVGEELDAWHDRKWDLYFPEWIDHKREQLPAYYDRLIQAGTWE